MDLVNAVVESAMRRRPIELLMDYFLGYQNFNKHSRIQSEFETGNEKQEQMVFNLPYAREIYPPSSSPRY
jgi:hypothetical protein